MMSITAATRDRLKAAGAVEAIVSDRVFRDERPQGTPLPAIVLIGAGGATDYHYRGRASVQRVRIQLDCWAGSRGDADALGVAVIEAMEGAADLGSIRFVRAFVTDRRDGSDRGETIAATGAAPLAYRASIDFFVWFKEV
ncbi:DUF3168 domain-containing protein [Sphingomonas montanisoli]|uniref:DUF3168 domain-containing protein n=1 Tax=Sphingomonas montanisoli TaxID=2606412 RepID=A0A5D9BYU0_9SPHN|nr:DUF3168 domain-containing protein [Sphingomonas montanisoli]TZG23890.1 DUF3168 domain-containing protein [Sphingomonas montanisoli]